MPQKTTSPKLQNLYYAIYRDGLFLDVPSGQWTTFNQISLSCDIALTRDYAKGYSGAIVLGYDPDEKDPNFQFVDEAGNYFLVPEDALN